MNHNKHFHRLLMALTAWTWALAAPMTGRAQAMPAKMVTYRNACLRMIDGMALRDKYALYEAKAAFDSVSLETVDLACTEGGEAQRPPTVLYCADYADSLIKHDFISAHLDNITIMRNNVSGDLMVFHRSLAPHASVTYQWEGHDECSLTVVSQQATQLHVSVTDLSLGQQWKANATPDGHCLQASWTMGNDDSPYAIRMENTGDEPVSFVVALN